jgi:hypothetical protein
MININDIVLRPADHHFHMADFNGFVSPPWFEADWWGCSFSTAGWYLYWSGAGGKKKNRQDDARQADPLLNFPKRLAIDRRRLKESAQVIKCEQTRNRSKNTGRLKWKAAYRIPWEVSAELNKKKIAEK